MRLFLFLIFIFNSASALDVNQSVKSTIEKNPKVKIAFEKLNESKELIESAYGKKLPLVTGSLSGNYSNSDSKTADCCLASLNRNGNSNKFICGTHAVNAELAVWVICIVPS